MFEGLTPTQKGAIAEAAIELEAIRHHVVVLRPSVEGRRYDVVFDVDHRLYRVQCKWGRLVDDKVCARLATCRFTPSSGCPDQVHGRRGGSHRDPLRATRPQLPPPHLEGRGPR